MNEKELAEIEARAEAATPGPWEVDNDLSVFTKDGGHGTPWTLFDTVGNEGEDSSNADFIAHARQDVPALVAEVRRLNEENSRLNFMSGKYEGESVALEYMNGERENENDALNAENKRLRAALEPFADMADTVLDFERQALANGYSRYYLLGNSTTGKTLVADDFRRAVEVLKGGAQ